jgi:ribosome-associated protein
MIDVAILEEPTALYKILKFESLVSSGGQAKAVIDSGLVLVNGSIETQRRKKIMAGDTIEFEGQGYSIVLR